MTKSWLIVKCRVCKYEWDVRAPRLHDVLEAIKARRVLCLSCGVKAVDLKLPHPSDLIAEMSEPDEPRGDA
jgi:hypothetical protein